MSREYTHIAVILDRTGSMEEIRDDTIGGFNAFLKAQKSVPGLATLTLVQFDSQDPYEIIHRFEPIEGVHELNRETYVPRASTPLLDAIGRGIIDLEDCLKCFKRDMRPSKVIFVVVTDGQENSSCEFTKDRIKKMIKDKEERERWQFVFLSADLDAFDDAMSVGFRMKSALMYEKNQEGCDAAWESLSKQAIAYRACLAPNVSFDESDRKHPSDPGKKK